MRQPITTPNAAEEFMRSLDQHPEIEQELRRRLLTQELLDIPNMDLLELLRKRGIEGAVDFLREALQVLVESIMDAEVSAQIGAQHGERNPGSISMELRVHTGITSEVPRGVPRQSFFGEAMRIGKYG